MIPTRKSLKFPMQIISVDFQKDFSAKEGQNYHPRPCIDFIKFTLVPHLQKYNLMIAEVISDYRLPRPYPRNYHECCVPGTIGYASEIPDDVKHPEEWIKCMNSPIWIRENGGIANKIAGLPYPDPIAFTRWLERTVGNIREIGDVVLIGLTLDCCVLCVAQELNFRGYNVKFLIEGVDAYNGSVLDKKLILRTPLANWGQPISWEQFKKEQLA